MVMQVIVLAVQNAVEHEYLGVATSGATLFRSIGGSLGTAVFGAIFANRLALNLANAFPDGASQGRQLGTNVSPAQIAQLPADVYGAYIHAFSLSLNTVFLIAAPIGAIGFILALRLPEIPLRKTFGFAPADEADEPPMILE